MRGANKLNSAIYFSFRDDEYKYFILTAGSESKLIYFNSLNIGCNTCDDTSDACLTCTANHYFYSDNSTCFLLDSCPSGNINKILILY